MKQMMMIIFFFFLIPPVLGFPLCTDSRAPGKLKAQLPFCGYNGTSCCNATDDSAIEKRFERMNISDSGCSAVVKSLLCMKCDPYSAEVFSIEPKIQSVPALCNSSSLRSSKLLEDGTKGFCFDVWSVCKNTSILNSPFAPSLQGSGSLPPVSASKLSDLWQSEYDFCKAFGGTSSGNSLCYDGKSVSFSNTENLPMPKGICFERVGNRTYTNMVPHPDGSDRVFLSNQAGKIWLATVPQEGSGSSLEFDESRPFLDLTDLVHFDTELGLMGLAFHPNFKDNGRFFVSLNCDKVQSESCSGRCACNSDVGCDPSKLGMDNGVQPCQYQSVIAEYTANSSSSVPSMAKTASPTEVRRIFTMGLPYTTHHAGQILFGPSDGYLYFMMGDGGSRGDPFNFSQNKKSMLGKIMRLDINNIPSREEILDLGLWGNYSIPKDNPYTEDRELAAEIWALGLANPWRCNFDSERALYFVCADVGQDTYEEVDLISKGGNYGWRVYEGRSLYNPPSSPGENTSASSIDTIFPVMGYNHNIMGKLGSASIIGGYVYRSMVDPCMYGRYIYADFYGANIAVGTEIPEGSGNYTSTWMSFGCAKDSPIACDVVAGQTLPSLGFVHSTGVDNRKDVFLLNSKGVYRVARPSRCGYFCPKEKIVKSPSGPSSSSSHLVPPRLILVLTFSFFILYLNPCLYGHHDHRFT